MNTSLHLKEELYLILEKEIQSFTSPLAWTSTVELSLYIMSSQILYIHQMFNDTHFGTITTDGIKKIQGLIVLNITFLI